MTWENLIRPEFMQTRVGINQTRSTLTTRMHSSKMHTVCSSSRLLGGRGWGCYAQGGFPAREVTARGCLPGGCISARGVSEHALGLTPHEQNH